MTAVTLYHNPKCSKSRQTLALLENKGGFIYAHWDGTRETENIIKEETKATIRCIPLDGNEESGSCMVTGNPSSKKVLFAKAY